MNSLLLLALVTLAPLEAFAADKEALTAWKEEVDSTDGRYALAVDPADARVDLSSLDKSAAAPAEVKLKLRRKNAAPVELRLKTLDRPNEPIRYTGSYASWNDSVVGFEVEVSFDRKSWRKIGRFFGVRK
jgi:hypothetical protein